MPLPWIRADSKSIARERAPTGDGAAWRARSCRSPFTGDALALDARQIPKASPASGLLQVTGRLGLRALVGARLRAMPWPWIRADSKSIARERAPTGGRGGLACAPL